MVVFEGGKCEYGIFIAKLYMATLHMSRDVQKRIEAQNIYVFIRIQYVLNIFLYVFNTCLSVFIRIYTYSMRRIYIGLDTYRTTLHMSVHHLHIY
jgi:hypothetical protein